MAWRFALMIDPAASDDARTDFADTFTVVDPTAPALNVGELSTQRGDGIFESIGVVDGHAQETQAHLDRLAHSAQLCDLPAPQPRAVAPGGRARDRAHRAGRERDQAHPEPRASSTDRRPTAWVTSAPAADFSQPRTRRHPRRHPRPRHRQRRAGPRAVAAARREDPVVRGEHGRDPRGEAPRGRRRDLRLVGRDRARGADRVGHPAVRRPLRDAGADRRHPARHDPAEPVRAPRRRRASRRPTRPSRRCAAPSGCRVAACRACGSPRRSPRSTASGSRTTPSSRHPSTSTC